MKRDVEAGIVSCSRCGYLIKPWQAWHLDHVDGAGPHDYRGASHRKCNCQTSTHRVERQQAVAELRPTF